MGQLPQGSPVRDEGEAVGMGIAAPPPPQQLLPHLLVNNKPPWRPLAGSNPSLSSMSQGFHQGIFNFSDGFDRRQQPQQQQPQQQQHIAQQSRREKLRVQGFDQSGAPMVSLDDVSEPIYEPSGGGSMLSDMFNFSSAAGPSSTELLSSQIPANFRPQRQAGFSSDWYSGNREGIVMGAAAMTSPVNADSASAMHMFLMNPLQQQQRSASPPSPDPSAFQTPFTSSSFGGGIVEGQGLSLSLSSSLQHLEMARAEELRFYGGPQQPQQARQLHFQGQHVGFGSSAGVVNMLRNSKYARPAQELLEEFCGVARGQLKSTRKGTSRNPNSAGGGSASTSSAAAGSSSSTKEPPPLSPADRFEHQRRKAKLLAMLDEACIPISLLSLSL